MRFAYSRARAHEWIEHCQVGKSMTLIEMPGEFFLLTKSASQQNAAKDCAQPFCPPFVYMIDWPVNFFSPTLAFCKP